MTESNMTEALPQRSPGFETSKAFRTTAIVIFLFGVAVHASKLVVGVDVLTANFLTPTIDGVFGLAMTFCVACGWVARRRLIGGVRERTAFWFVFLFVAISEPIHLRSWVLGSTALYGAFPDWYSVAEIPLFLALAAIAARLRFA